MVRRNKIIYLPLCGLVAALTAVGAYVRVPMWPVPFTLQTLFVMLGGSILPVGHAFAAQMVYVACGLIGLPVFAAGGGLGVVLHPTFGYLAAFPLASALASALLSARREVSGLPPSWGRLLLANGTAALLILIMGVAYLYFNLNVVAGKAIGPGAALWAGAIVFLPGEALKAVLVCAVARRVWHGIRR